MSIQLVVSHDFAKGFFELQNISYSIRLVSSHPSCGVRRHRPAKFVRGASNPQSTNVEDVKQLPTVQGNTRRSTGISTDMNATRTEFFLTTELEGMTTWTIKMMTYGL